LEILVLSISNYNWQTVCLSATMDIQRVCVPVSEVRYFWQFRICDPFAQGPIVSLVGQCIVWIIIFCCYRRLKLFFHGRQREERHQELLRDHQYRSKTERDNIEQMLTPAAKCKSGGTAEKPLEPVPVSLCVDNTCGAELFADLSLRDAASLLRVPDEEVTFLQTSAGLVVQTKVTRLTWPCTKQKRLRFLVQLGRWRLILRPSTGKCTVCIELFRFLQEGQHKKSISDPHMGSAHFSPFPNINVFSLHLMWEYISVSHIGI
jgi:hypothetical protein